jgi:GNAT superfamily N-acetyltransferase
MHPFIQHKDFLTVKPLDNAKLHIGDVVLCHGSDGIVFAHRIVRINRSGSSTIITTKGDSQDYLDHPIRKEQVLGRVTVVERDDRILKFDRGLNKMVSRYWAKVSPMSRRLRPILKPVWRIYRLLFQRVMKELLLETALRKAQGIIIYRRIAGWARAGVVIKEANEEDTRQLRGLDAPGRAGDSPAAILKVTRIVAQKGLHIVGYIDLVDYPESFGPLTGCWIFDLEVKTYYRGSGIGEALVRKAMQKSRSQGIRVLSLLVEEKNDRAINLYHKLGFKRTLAPEFKKQPGDEQRNPDHHRIAMSICLE